jgi:hypothetical protein
VSNTGYKVTCDGTSGGGSFVACDDATCSRCNPPTAFAAGQCVPNPPEFGSRSVLFNCGTGGGGGGGGGGVSPVTGGGGGVAAPAPAGSSGAASVAVSVTAAGVAVAAAARGV